MAYGANWQSKLCVAAASSHAHNSGRARLRAGKALACREAPRSRVRWPSNWEGEAPAEPRWPLPARTEHVRAVWRCGSQVGSPSQNHAKGIQPAGSRVAFRSAK